ncbi:GNAT family N-acetyltransferase [Pelagibacterium limicola]|uniref:GNAT family N-acetyltransferase n=1 Tax=Pelagibacterium limicola TaxID=2791022 RepID=UPI0018AF5E0C|nr:GNAT family N-acetyltransferase [Pelagibacterium limicola]
MPAPHIRPATAEDLAFIVNLIEADGMVGSTEDTANPQGPGYMAALAAIEADPNQLLLIAELDGQPVGTFQLTFTPGISRKGAWRCTIEGVHVSPEHRNKKIGETMMVWAVETARARNCVMVQLTSNKARTNAHRFYNRLGFKQSHEGFKLMLG